MMRPSPLVLSLILVATLSACKKDNPEAPPAPAASAPSAPAPTPASVPPPAPAAAPASAATTVPAGQSFDLQSVPVTSKTPPAFPYMATPAELDPKNVYTERNVEFDRVYVIAGEELRAVEGKVMQRKFSLNQLKWSALAAHRNYENAFKEMGAVRVDKVHPRDDKFIERSGGELGATLKRMGIPFINRLEDPDKPGFEQWLLRTPTTNVWMSFAIDNGQVYLLTVEEKAMQQQVQALPAARLSSALQQDGHVALYLNFDTDSQVIRQDSLPAVDEVVKLMQDEPALKLRVEGHTDASGDAARNRTLSLARARSVVRAITAKQVAAERLSAVGKGPDQPLADNGSAEGRAKNRRVELVRT